MKEPVAFTPELVRLLGESNPDMLRVLRLLEKRANDGLLGFRDPVRPPPAMTDAPTHGGTAQDAIDMLTFHVRLMRMRWTELLCDLVASTNGRRVLGVALSARALLETVAVASYHREQFEKAEGSGPRDVVIPKLVHLAQLATVASRFDWVRALGDDPGRRELLDEYAKKDKRKVPVQATNVLTCLDALRRRLAAESRGNAGILDYMYDLLSDLCHPSAGQWLSHICFDPDGIGLELEASDSQIRGLCTKVLATVELLAKILDEAFESAEAIGVKLRTTDA